MNMKYRLTGKFAIIIEYVHPLRFKCFFDGVCDLWNTGKCCGRNDFICAREMLHTLVSENQRMSSRDSAASEKSVDRASGTDLRCGASDSDKSTAHTARTTQNKPR